MMERPEQDGYRRNSSPDRGRPASKGPIGRLKASRPIREGGEPVKQACNGGQRLRRRKEIGCRIYMPKKNEVDGRRRLSTVRSYGLPYRSSHTLGPGPLGCTRQLIMGQAKNAQHRMGQ